jgi:outer membrane protein assembly factor BamA
VRTAIVAGAWLLAAVTTVAVASTAEAAPPPVHTATLPDDPPAPEPRTPATAPADPLARSARAPAPPVPAALVERERRPLAGFAVRGASKVKPQTLGYLAHVELGELIGDPDLARITQALTSSELFKQIEVTLEDAPGAANHVILVATAVDKQSWIIAPAIFALPGNTAIGVGYAENNFEGLGQKFLIYAQLGTRTSLLFATFLDPSYRGSKLTWRTDLYSFHRAIDEYVNPHDDPTSFAIGRTTTATYLGAAALIGWSFRWWLVGDLRLRGAYVYFRDAQDARGNPVPLPEQDGWDVTLQAHLTLDRRHHKNGVTWGSYAQLDLEPSVPGLDDYGYQLAMLRAYHSWRLFEAHELELRGHLNVGRKMPLHEDFTLGGVPDLRGYDLDQFRGDVRSAARAEYSVPIGQWRFLLFRAIGFYDVGYVGFHAPRPERQFLPNQLTGGYVRNNVGAGLRIYVNNIVLPLLGLDFGYGLEGRSPEIYFEVGLTDF